MKIRTASSQSGNLLLVIIALICLAGILYIGYKIVSRLSRWQIDPHHGQGTNALVDPSVLERIRQLEATNRPAQTSLPDFNLTMPATAMAYDWHYAVETSTNLTDWSSTPLEWEQITNDLTQPLIFYRTVIWW